MVYQIGRIVSIITGGGRGLGRAVAEHFVKHGGKVTILDLPESEAGEVADKLGTDNCSFCPCDVTSTEDVTDAIELTVRKFGGLHALVNCAGISDALSLYHIGRDEPHQMEMFENVFETNVVGTFNAIRFAVPEMIKNDPDEDGQRGVIINTSSIAGFEGEKGQLAYASSMAAVNAMTLPLARDLRHHGIRISTIAPGYFSTPLFEYVPQKIKDLLTSQTPFPTRFGIPQEYAAMAQTIIENSYINGEVIRLDGALRPASGH